MRSYPLRARLACAALLAAIAVPLHAAPDDAPPGLITAAVRLRHAKASRVAAQLIAFTPRDAPGQITGSLPTLPGVKSLSADDATRRITVSGSRSGIAQLRKLVSLLDQPVSEVKLRASLTSAPYIPGDDSIPSTTILVRSDVVIGNMETVRVPLSADGVAVQSAVTARINGDRSVTLAYTTDTRWRSEVSQGVSDHRQGLQSSSRLKLGEVLRLPLTALQADGTGIRSQLFLELTPLSVKVP